MRPSIYAGPVLPDLAVWGGAAWAVGYGVGFATAIVYNYIFEPPQHVDWVWLGGVGAGVLTVFMLTEVCVGHILLPILS